MKKYKGFWIFILWKPYTPYAKATEVTAISKCHTGRWSSGLIFTCNSGCDIEGECSKSDSKDSKFLGIWVGYKQTNKLTQGIWHMKKYKGFWIFILWKPYTPYAKATEVTAISKCHWQECAGRLIFCMCWGSDIEGECSKSDSKHSNFLGIWVGDKQTHKGNLAYEKILGVLNFHTVKTLYSVC